MFLSRPCSFLCSLFLSIVLFADLAAAPLDSQVEQLIAQGASQRAIWGVYAVDTSNGNVLVDVNGTRMFVPASNRKLVSTAMAVHAFKKDDRLTTELRAEAMSSDGIVAGDVVLHAVGDPSWTPEFLGGRSGTVKINEIAQKAREAGLLRVDGNLVVDIRRFVEPEPTPPGWSWEELSMSYASRPAALAINQNLVGVAMTPSATGEPLRVSFPIGVEAFKVVNNSYTLGGGAAPTLVLDRELGGNSITLRGGLPAGSQQISRALPSGAPVDLAARLLREAMEKEGIVVRGGIVFENRPNGGNILLAAVDGAPFDAMLKSCNEESNNFLAESLYLLAAAKLSGRTSYAIAQEVEKSYWKRIGVDSAEIVSSDGSGLSRKNHITPRALVMLLQHNKDIDWFVDSLPVSGHTGTLRHRLSANGMARRVQAKTGTLDGSSGLSGYVKTNSGRTVAFSIIANNYSSSSSPIRAKIDEIVVLLAGR